MPFAELDAVWDGNALLISVDRTTPELVRIAGFAPHALTLLGVVLAVWAARTATRRPAFALIGVACALSGGWHTLHPDGFLRNPESVRRMATPHFPMQTGSVSRDELAELVGQPGVTILDARSQLAYQAGHLPGATNVPVGESWRQRQPRLQGVPPTSRLIVYCQSDQCPWAEEVSTDLLVRGFTNVSVYRGGWKEWLSRDSLNP